MIIGVMVEADLSGETIVLNYFDVVHLLLAHAARASDRTNCLFVAFLEMLSVRLIGTITIIP